MKSDYLFFFFLFCKVALLLYYFLKNLSHCIFTLKLFSRGK